MHGLDGFRIGRGAGDARSQGKDGAVVVGDPALGQAQGKDKDVGLFEHGANSAQVPLAIIEHGFHALEAAWLNLRPKGIDKALFDPPGRLCRLEQTEGALE
ncbi:hypothetical protein D3C80_1777540 [compost metagenome]